MKQRRIGSEVVFLDLMMNALLSFVAMFILAFVQISPKKDKDADPAIATEGKYMVVIGWPDSSQDDVDLYVRDPAGNIAFFQSKDAGLMHLERDDLGRRSDSVATKNGMIFVQRNEERVIIRGIIAGEYVVNVHMFRKSDPSPTAVRIFLYSLTGSDAEVVARERTLRQNGDEQTAFRFTLSDDGAVSGITDLSRRIVGDRPQGQ